MKKKNIKGKKLRRELFNQVRDRINSGEDREKILDDLSSIYFERDEIASFISRIPLQDDIKEISKYNNWLLRIIYTFGTIRLVFGFVDVAHYILVTDNTLRVKIFFLLMSPIVFLVPVICFWFATQIKRYDGFYYRFIGLCGIIAICNILGGDFQGGMINWIFNSIIIVMLAVGAWLAFRIRKRFFPNIEFGGTARAPGGKYILDRGYYT